MWIFGPVATPLIVGIFGGCVATPPNVEHARPAAIHQPVMVETTKPAPTAPPPEPEVVPAPPKEVVPAPPKEVVPPAPGCGVTHPKLAQAPAATIEDTQGAMTPFYEAMVDTLLKRDGAVTRIGHWSDSTLASDGPDSRRTA